MFILKNNTIHFFRKIIVILLTTRTIASILCMLYMNSR
jgi:hypothetical protein